MIHELLICLSGLPSPLLTSIVENGSDVRNPLQSLLSPAEATLLKSLAHDLGATNSNIRKDAAIICSHPSIVCRAVSAAIVSTHLAKFQRKILEVEKDILVANPSIIGAYNIAPLSAIAGAFDGWARRLDFLRNVVRFIRSAETSGRIRLGQKKHDSCTAADIIEHLRKATHTGYPDLEQISLDLVAVAETAWLKQISAWILYGRYPAIGAADFFITPKLENKNESDWSATDFVIQQSLVPDFVTPSTANSILFIGRSLKHIRERQLSSMTGSPAADSLELTFLPIHQGHLSSLQFPISSSAFSTAIRAIRLSLSQNTLSKLLPLSKVLEMLHLLKNFFFLERGEFAVALIAAADERLVSRQRIATGRLNQDIVPDLASMTIKEGEVYAVLARTWTSIASMRSIDDEDGDEELDRARELISLSIKSVDTESTNSRDLHTKPLVASFDDLLLPSPTSLGIRVPSPLDLFLTSLEVSTYSRIHAYLLAIRRAHLRLSKLFLLSILRREHPSSMSQASLHHNKGSITLAKLRASVNQRSRTMRPIWATIGSAAFLLAEMGEYFQGEVIQSSWSTFQRWLVPHLFPAQTSIDTSLLSSVNLTKQLPGSRPVSSRCVHDAGSQAFHDPESLAQAHRSYLTTLESSLLLDDQHFTILLRQFMTSVDHMSALMHRLDRTQEGLDVQIDVGTDSTSTGYLLPKERHIIDDLSKAQRKIVKGVEDIIDALKSIDSTRTRAHGRKNDEAYLEDVDFVPWHGAGVDRLLLKFEFGKSE